MHGEDGVPNPTEAVIPVTLTANLLGEGGGGGCDDGPGRGVRERLQRDRRAFDADAGAVAIGNFRRPLIPPVSGLVKLGAQPFGRVVPNTHRLVPLRAVILQSETARLAGAHAQLPSQVMGILDLQRHVTVDQQARVAAAGKHCLLAYRPDPRFDLGEIQAGHDVYTEDHRAADAAHDPDEFPARALAPSRAHGEEIDQLGFVASRLEGRDEDEAVAQVGAPAGVTPRRCDRKVAAPVPVQQSAEATVGVETGKAAPIDHSIARDQRGGMTVANERVIG